MNRLFLFLALLPLLSRAQLPESPKTGRLSVGLVFSPDICYRTLTSGESGKWLVDSRNAFEIPKFGYTTGLSLIYKLKGHIRLETGLLFSDKGQKTKSETINVMEPDTLFPQQFRLVNKYYYLDIPLKLNWLLRDKRLKLLITAGLSANIFLSEQTTSFLNFENGTTKKYTNHVKNSGLSAVNLAFLAGFAAEYELSKHLIIRLEPIYRRSLTPIVNSSLKTYLYSTGMNTGIYYKL
jgi:hypothetical protein